jgi:Leucine-rich repeat (LRR) protein
MRSILVILAITAQLVCANRSSPGDTKAPGESKPKVVKEQVRGGVAFAPEKRQWFRITGKVKVQSAHTLIYEDGTEVDLNGGIDAPELEQKGLIGDSFYPCGKEAAEFLRKLIGDKTVTCFAGLEHVEGKKIRIASAFVGETNLNIELVRNGWAVSHHSGMDPWEVFARENKRGMWRGTFVVPERWCKGERLKGEQPDDSAAEQKATAALRELGGKTQTEDGRIVILSLGGNKVADAALEHLKNLPHLRSLNLSGTSAKITDAGLAHLAGLTNLKRLHLANLDGVTDAGLINLKGLSMLKSLAITHTRSISGTGLVHLRGLRRLESLNFNHTPITNERLAHLKDLTGLKSLGLRRTKITDAGLKHLKGLENLERLNLWGTKVTDDGLALVAKLPRIKDLLLVGASITADGLKHLKDMPALENLELRDVPGGDHAVLEHVGRLTHLKRLEFHNMNVTEADLKHLAKLTNLEVLLLVGSRIPDAGFAHLKVLTGLKNLNLSRVPITDKGLAHLKGLTALEELHLSETKITDAGLAHLKGLTILTNLGLMSTQISDAGLEHLTGLAKLRNVSLLGTRVTDQGVKKLKEALPKLAVYYR